ncbi:MAG: carbohydrate ABC transporter permease [Phycisphaeraceae bacterium]|nr:carbohydrate ABC transporter permease [Phycisphaeraceae bacterium]
MNAHRGPALPARLIVHALVWGLALTMLVPFLWMVLTSLKTDAEATAPLSAASLLPSRPVFENYPRAFEEAGLARVYRNSLIVATVTTLLAVSHNALAGYAFAKLRFRGRRLLLACVVATMLLPIQCYFLFAYVFAGRLGLVDNLQAMIVPFLASGFGILFMRQAIQGIPEDLFDAGRLDGMRELDLFWTIARPAAWPAIAALAIISFVNAWNAFFWPLIVTDSPEHRTLPLAIAELSAGVYVQSWPVQMAAATLMVLPLIGVFFLCQRAFVRGLTSTGLKE